MTFVSQDDAILLRDDTPTKTVMVVGESIHFYDNNTMEGLDAKRLSSLLYLVIRGTKNVYVQQPLFILPCEGSSVIKCGHLLTIGTSTGSPTCYSSNEIALTGIIRIVETDITRKNNIFYGIRACNIV